MEKIMTSRPQRNRRHSRRAWPPEDDLHQPRLVKRLFTPEIKRMLKDWLVRRRENPYPSRDEKKCLAIETGLTYTQICNWFANWRRKLKNSERQPNQPSWGDLIKNYNTNARGNVEQFSISSEDSIWEENELGERDGDDDEYESREDGISSSNEGTTASSSVGYGSYVKTKKRSISQMDYGFMKKNQFCVNRNLQKSIIPTANAATVVQHSMPHANETVLAAEQQAENATKSMVEKTNYLNGNAKYKQKMMEKYLRDTNDEHLSAIPQQTTVPNISISVGLSPQPVESAPASGDVHLRNDNTALTKWLESAARFTPDKNNYFIEWNGRTGKLERKQRSKQLRRVTIIPANSSILQRHSTHSCPTQLELDAAEALANMAFNCRQRILDCGGGTPTTGLSLQTVNAIIS